MNLLDIAKQNLVSEIKGRYVTLEMILPFLKTLTTDFKLEVVGQSTLGKDIPLVTFGRGSKKLLMWSQMHGNESTTTKGLLDFLHYLNSDSVFNTFIKENFTLYMVPILNPDGAEAYTRVNANEVDLNRDAFNLSQPESKVLRKLVEQIQPDYCFNLHDQRTIFGTIGLQKPATMSFLAPAYNEEREVNDVRLKAMHVINKMYDNLQGVIPDQIGRFDDSFNINCIGDYLTAQQIPTILFEAGHFQDDYERDTVRKFVFIALISAVYAINENVIVDNDLEKYLTIPQNSPHFFDFIYKNVKIIENNQKKIINFAAQYSELLENGKVIFEARIAKVGNLEENVGHCEFDGANKLFSAENINFPKIGRKADFYLDNLLKFCNGLKINN
ncbi:peptidase M14 [Flavobacterium sediminis]|uniref:Peptidase M14 n=1 Tax=Flavobacterium sediminis TaxID=2201181 RepID=A0A2U8QYY4_9FLAO|nr:M14 metallopeptidase family protein [Flavobacterium sediminis]AWM15064.1 peptidase M14 [Flavobacterium sediminis]